MKNWIPVLILSILFLAGVGQLGKPPTGYISAEASLSLAPKMDGEISGFSYDDLLDIAERQLIGVEFANTGSAPYDTRITITVYYYNVTRLQEKAEYIDSMVYLHPGQRKAFSVLFTPDALGDYYIKVLVSYSYKKATEWGYFLYYIEPEEQEIPIDITPTTAPTPQAPVVSNLIPGIQLSYPSSINITQGEGRLVPITVSSTGTLALTNIRFYVSSSQGLYSDINPKVLDVLNPKNSFTFLLSLDAENDTETGFYPVDFTVLAEEIKEYGSIDVYVNEKGKTASYDWESLKNTIESYKYIISELESKVEFYASYGADVSDANATLSSASHSLQDAEQYYIKRNYEACSSSLDKTKGLLEDAALKIGNLSMQSRIPSAGIAIWLAALILVVIALAVIAFLVYSRRKRGDGRPSFLSREE